MSLDWWLYTPAGWFSLGAIVAIPVILVAIISAIKQGNSCRDVALVMLTIVVMVGSGFAIGWSRLTAKPMPPPSIPASPLGPYAWDTGFAKGLNDGKIAGFSSKIKKPLTGVEIERRVWDICNAKYPSVQSAELSGNSRNYSYEELGYPFGVRQGLQETMHARWPKQCPEAEIVSAGSLAGRFKDFDMAPRAWDGSCNLGPRP